MEVKQTAGRDSLGTFASEFVHLNDDILFGEVWSREEKLSLRDRSLVTVVSLMSQGSADNSLKFHLNEAKKNGITKDDRNNNTRSILRRLAKSVGNIQSCKRSLE